MKVDFEATHSALKPPATRIGLVVSDIDGTLIGPDKKLTPETISAARALREAGIALCLVSSRSPEGMVAFRGPLGLDTPYAGLNGGMVVSADGDIVASLSLPAQAASDAYDMLHVHHVDAWLFRGHDWLIRDAGAPYVAHEERAVGIKPTVVPDFRPYFEGVGKIMGSSADYPLLQRMEVEIGAMLEGVASVHRSSDYYLDITHHDANKGYAARMLAKTLGVDMGEVACIGDMTNDIPMLKVAGLAIAMGQSSEAVRAWAHEVTAANDQNGWAMAMRQFVLPRAPVATGTKEGEAP
ncbi:Cof-type HAD-IIB family hydrolase [Brytella acorum]|uniref:Cof-type HAD-IIB family hydrolase n=1 Tax=Brytella acorum TaxID=2959299 RepID=A0AA35UWI9_9PROT|nr:Cof-type HAD-IIB family hydrolase [Brytella acorum]MDF3623874.1 Cof-type HAD-IIB family hydrolase [Brytella acorum]CAI9120790.1 Cof-type HAD-IIB family hydrolase [Brytella acorum]